MPDLLVLAVISGAAIFLFAVAIGSNLFVVMVNEQVRCLRENALSSPMPGGPAHRSRPEPVSRYLAWAAGDKKPDAGCARIRFHGRMKIGKNGRWMKTGGSACFSLAVPDYVWHATITFAPGIWIEACDFYINRTARMHFSLFSFFPLNKVHGHDIPVPSLFQYLASAPLFPQVLASSDSVSWENINESAAIATIHDGDIPARALVRFDGNGRPESITAYDPESPARNHPVPGMFASRFSGYAETGGYHVPFQVVSEYYLPDGAYACMEYTVNGIDYMPPEPVPMENSG